MPIDPIDSMPRNRPGGGGKGGGSESKNKETASTKKLTQAERELLQAQHDRFKNQEDVERLSKKLAALKELNKNKLAAETAELKRQTQADIDNLKAKEKVINANKKYSASIKRNREKLKILADQYRHTGLKLRDVTKGTDLFKRALQGEARALASIKRRMKEATTAGTKLNKQLGFSIRNTRNGATSFSVLRSNILLASFAYGLIVQKIVNLVKTYGEQERAEKAVFQALTSTGHASRLLGEEVISLASSYQKLTGIGDEVILKSSSLLLSFTKIGREVFPDAQKAILDTASAMYQGNVTSEALKTTTIQIGKALQDPIKGMTALQRVGVSFSAQQKENVKNLVNLGKTAEAQKIILAELRNEFGGMAQAFRNTAEGSLKALSAALGDLQEKMGRFLAPIVLSIADAMTAFAESLDIRKVKEYAVSMGILSAGFITYGLAVNKATISTKVFSKALRATGVGIALWGIAKVLEMTGVFEDSNDAIDSSTTKIEGWQKALIRANETGIDTFITRKKAELADLQTELDELGTPAASTMEGGLITFIVDENSELRANTIEKQRNAQAELDWAETLKARREAPLADQVAKETLKYQDQLKVLGETNVFHKELSKVSLKLFGNKTDLIDALEDETHKYHELAEAIQGVVEKQKREKDINALKGEIYSELTNLANTHFDNEIARMDEVMNKDIANVKKSSAYKLAQKRGDNKTMKKLEDEARKQTLPGRVKAFKNKRNVALAGIAIDAAGAIVKAFKDYGWPGGLIPAGLITTSAGLQASTVLQQKPPKYAKGGDFVTAGPQTIIVGDNPGGRERVSVTPLSSPNIAGPQGGSVNISFSGNVLSQDFIEDEAIPMIKEAVRRGADIGVA